MSVRSKKQERQANAPFHDRARSHSPRSPLVYVIFVPVCFVNNLFANYFFNDIYAENQSNLLYHRNQNVPSNVMTPIAPPATPGVCDIRRR